MAKAPQDWDFNDNSVDPVSTVDETRRTLLKMAAGLVAIGATSFMLPSLARAEPSGGRRILIAYFSRTGTTREVAQQIQHHIGGDLLELKTVTPYPAAYRATTNQAKQEQQENARPALTAQVANMAAYDTLLLGFPNWWGTLPMAFFTFLDQYDLAGKSIIPFCTHEGSGFGSSLNDLGRYCGQAKLQEGLALRGGGVDNVATDEVRAEIRAWLDGLALVARKIT